MKTKAIDIYAMVCTTPKPDLTICGGILIPCQGWEEIEWECQECEKRNGWYQTVYSTVIVSAKTGEQSE